MRKEIRFSGFGGQGIILSAVILGRAAVMYDSKFAVQTQVYGPEARGGASKSEVIISDGTIHYPEVENPDILVALTQEAVDKFAGQLKPTGILITDTKVKKLPAKGAYTTYVLPIRDTADEIRGEIVTNMVTLGALVALTKIVSREALTNAVLARIPKGTETINMKAFAAGIKIAEQGV